jgi:hypothetical protein
MPCAGGLYYKAFYERNQLQTEVSCSICHLSLTFAIKTESTRVESLMELHSKGRLLALPPIYKSKLEVTVSDKRSSLLLYEINRGRKKMFYRTFLRNIRLV